MLATALILAPEVLAQVVSHAREARPREAVGLLGGHPNGAIALALPLVNVAPGDRAFLADPYSQYSAMQRLEAERLTLLAIYHSHPGGGVDPSPEDLAHARLWPCAHLIVALPESADGGERLGAFRLSDSGGTETVTIRFTA